MLLGSEISGQRALVTGASGFLGSRLCRRLLTEGAELHCVSRYAPVETRPGVTWHALDLADAASAQRVVLTVQPDIVFHLASRVTGSRDLVEVLPTLQANLAGTAALFAALCGTRCRRVVVTGSLEETSLPGETPGSPYAAAKSAATSYARMFHGLYSLPVVIARLFMVYGPDSKNTSRLIPYVIQSLLNNRQPRLSSGQRQVDWVFVDDVVEGLLRAATCSRVDGETIDFGSGELLSVRGVVERISSLLDSSVELQFGALPDRPMEKVARADVQRTFQLTGWRPSTMLDDGLRLTIEWYRQAQQVESKAQIHAQAASPEIKIKSSKPRLR